jgi:phage/plasmid-associated DNA primase
LQIILNEILTEQRATRADIARIDSALAEKRGERRVALWLAGAIGGVVSFLVGVFSR